MAMLNNQMVTSCNFNNSSTASWFLLTLTGWPVHTRHSEQIHGARGVSWLVMGISWLNGTVGSVCQASFDMSGIVFGVAHVGKSIVIGGRHCWHCYFITSKLFLKSYHGVNTFLYHNISHTYIHTLSNHICINVTSSFSFIALFSPWSRSHLWAENMKIVMLYPLVN